MRQKENKMKPKRCNNCKFFMTQDEGYSNYTVLETIVNCLKRKNQYFPCEESYSWLSQDSEDYKQLQVAENCEEYKECHGIQIQFDVEGEATIDDYSDDNELVDAYNKWCEKSKEA